MAPHSAGLSVEKPVAPHARANAAKPIGCSSHPYSGFPRNTICSHLIIPSELFLTMTTLIGSLYLTQFANSAINIEKPPSPTNATTWRSGYATCAAIAYGRPLAIDASVPESEYICPCLTGICRAHHVVIVPLSDTTIASLRRRFPSSQATT